MTAHRNLAEIDPASRVPMHVQVRRLIRREALRGELVDSAGRLKTEAELGAIFGVSRITIRSALQQLVDEGLFSRTRGKGTFLLPTDVENWGGTLMGFVETVREAGSEPGGIVLHKGMTNRHDKTVAATLNERAVFELKRLRVVDGNPVAIEQAFYPPDIGLELDRRDLADAAIYKIFEDDLAFEIGDAQQTIGATLADADQARNLDVDPGTALTCVERVTHDTSGRVLELLHAVYVPDRFKFSIRLTRRKPVA